MLTEKCVCDWCGEEVEIGEKLNEIWKYNQFNACLQTRPLIDGPEGRHKDISIPEEDENICINCANEVMEAVTITIKSIRGKRGKNS